MTNQRFLSVSLMVLALLGASAAALAQDAPASRGTVKVRPRFFNPFQPTASRLTLNPFGVFSFAQPAGLPASVASSSTVAASTAAGGGSVEASEAVLSGDELGGSGGVVRPPFRPPVRSPFRPPPRPPF